MNYSIAAAIWDLAAHAHLEGQLEWLTADQALAIKKVGAS
jgi:hypothetical protein